MPYFLNISERFLAGVIGGAGLIAVTSVSLGSTSFHA